MSIKQKLRKIKEIIFNDSREVRINGHCNCRIIRLKDSDYCWCTHCGNIYHVQGKSGDLGVILFLQSPDRQYRSKVDGSLLGNQPVYIEDNEW